MSSVPWLGWLGCAFLASAISSSSAAQLGDQVSPANTSSLQQSGNTAPDADSSLRLGVGDLIEFSVYNVPELSSKVRVGSNGDVYLPLVDYVHVAGLKPEEAQAVIEKRFTDGGFLKDPHVSIFVDEYQSQGVSVLGEVSKPSVYPALGQQRLFDMISAAGGFSDKAGRSITVTHRSTPDKPETIPLARNFSDNPDSNVAVYKGDTGMSETPVHLKKMLAAKVPDMPMEADDILFVPNSTGKIIAGRTLQAA